MSDDIKGSKFLIIRFYYIKQKNKKLWANPYNIVTK